MLLPKTGNLLFMDTGLCRVPSRPVDGAEISPGEGSDAEKNDINSV